MSNRGATSSLCGRRAQARVRVVDESGKDVAAGVPGELSLAARTLCTATGIIGEPALRFVMAHLRSGDIGYQNNRRVFLHTGPPESMIVNRWENVYSAEVEGVIDEHPPS